MAARCGMSTWTGRTRAGCCGARRCSEGVPRLDPHGFRNALRALGWVPVRLRVAQGFLQRLVGLLAYAPPGSGELPVVLGFPCCRSVHTCLMRYSIDIAFLDACGRVIEVRRGIAPWRRVSCPNACAVLERPSMPPPAAGTADARAVHRACTSF